MSRWIYAAIEGPWHMTILETPSRWILAADDAEAAKQMQAMTELREELERRGFEIRAGTFAGTATES